MCVCVFVCCIHAGSDAVQGKWMNYGTAVGPNASSKRLTVQLPHDLNRTVQKGVQAERIAAHPPELLSEGLPPPAPEEISLANKDDERVVLYMKSEKLLQSKDARKGRSIMHSFNGRFLIAIVMCTGLYPSEVHVTCIGIV